MAFCWVLLGLACRHGVTVEIGVVDLDLAGQTLAGIPLEHDLLQLVLDLPGPPGGG